jgi:diguanylate cyclase (GGDEF)-like protein/putative nucleotidyltransferase with HDIG domain
MSGNAGRRSIGHLRLVDDMAPEMVPELLERGRAAERQGRRDDARANYERALTLAREAEDFGRASAILRWIGRTWGADGDVEAALRFTNEALAVAESARDDGAAGHALNAKAAILSPLGDLDEAERLYLRARSFAIDAGDAKLAAMTAQNLGVVACVRGELSEALRHYELSLAEYRTLGLASDVCVALTNIGKVYTAQCSWEAAERAFEEAMHIAEALGEVAVRAQLEVNLAEMLVARADWPRALTTLERAVTTARNAADSASLGEAHKLSGVVARETGDAAGAEQHFTKAEEIAETRRDLLLVAEICRERAESCRRQGRSRDALQFLNRAHRIFTQLRARRHIADVHLRIDDLEADFEAVARRWGESIEAKDQYTQGHCVRVADLSCLLASQVGFGERDLAWFRIGALLHDVGKLVIPADVLNKADRLTEDEWALMRRHPSAGVEMLGDIDFPWDVRPMIESHHERWDGSGYPHGLSGESIPLTARVLAIADVYDALTTARSYKPAVPHDAALELMRRDAGFAFDPAIFPVFEEIVRFGAPTERPLPLVDDGPALAPARPAATPAAADPVDELTGLRLRRAFGDASSQLLESAERVGASTSLLVIDVDYFKLVNDSFGHLQGDDMLRAVADELRAAAGLTDVVGRYAGDEFVALLPGRTLDEACAIAERLRIAVEAHHCPRRERPGETVNVTLSIGVATSPQHGTSFEALFAAADSALYGAKRRGRNAVTPAASVGAREAEIQIDRFAGRRDERQRVEKLLAAAAGGDPRVLAVVGEAGVGKSTLVRQLAPSARVRGGTLASALCLEADVRPPYGPWADLLGALHAQGLVPRRTWRELPRLVPALRDPSAPLAGEGSRYALLEEIADFLRAASAQRPLVIVLDDVQWADGSTWDVLEFVASRLSSERMLICLTVRSEDLRGENADRRRRLSRLACYEELALPRLTRAEVGQWLDVVFEGQLEGDALLGYLASTAEGNPLFTGQMLRTLIDDGAVSRSAGRWRYESTRGTAIPVAVDDLLMRRLERLSDEARRVLSTGAVIGREFDAEVLAAASEQGEDVVLDALDAGLDAAVLRMADARDGSRFVFTHALLVDALRRSINPLRLKRTHERVARVLAERTPDSVAEIAIHFDRAGCSEPAYRASMMAGERAVAVYAYDEATAFFDIAERHAPTPADVARAEWQLARVAEARANYGEVETRCNRLVDEHADGAAVAGVLRSARRLRENARLLRGDDATAVRERVIALLADARAADDATDSVELLALLSQTQSRLGDSRAAETVAREGVEAAEALGDQRLLAMLVMRLGTAQIAHHPSDAVRHFRRAHDLYAALDDARGQLRCHVNTGVANDRAENQPAAETSYAAALELGRRIKAPEMAGGASLNLGVLLMKTGRFDGAEACFVEALGLFTAIANEPLRLAALYNQANLARERGDPAASVPLYERAMSAASALGQLDVRAGAVAGLALAQLDLGARAAAEARRVEITAILPSRDGWWFQGAELYEALQVRLVAERDPAAARELLVAGMERAGAVDGYAAAWLLAACSALLVGHHDPRLSTLASRYAVQARARGYLPLVERFASVRVDTEATVC